MRFQLIAATLACWALACSGDAKFPEGSGGASGAAGSAGGGSSAGAHQGGSAGASAGTSSGGARDCELVQCFRAIECVNECGGPVLRASCCPCDPPAFDSISCAGAGGR